MSFPQNPPSRRAFLAASVGAGMLSPAEAALAAPLLDVDYRKLVSRADLVYEKPAARSEEGIPIGNGRMGSLVWTTPTQLRFQINRVDVYASNCASNSFFERHTDYCGGCGFVDIDFGSGAAPFPETGFGQHLFVYDGALRIEGKGVTARLLAWPEHDVIAISVDGGATPMVRLRMLRFEANSGQSEKLIRDHIAVVQTRSRTAASQLVAHEDRIALSQEFREGDFCCKSAVAIAVDGRKGEPQWLNETEVGLAAPGSSVGPSAYTILIASAATFDPNEDVVAAAFRALDAAQSKGFAPMESQTAAWWHDFWRRSFVHLTSSDGEADFVERNYTYFLYLMGAASRGKFPAKFNGMLWNSGGDFRSWGSQHWFANLSCYYEALPAANRWELMDPMYDMYSGMYQACATAARQQWGSQGMYIPETVYFDGLEKLPDDIAGEMQPLYLLQKPWEQRSGRFREFALTKLPHSSRWNWIESGAWVNGRWTIKDRGYGPYGPVNHSFASTAKIAYLFWRRYEFTLDRDWLAKRAYPMLRGAVEFYRNYPNVKKGEDGKYHIHFVNSNEGVFGARDTDEDLSAMRGVTAALLRAAAILGADADMRPLWTEFLANLAPLPTSADPAALKPANYQGPRVFVRGLIPAVKGGNGLSDGNSLPTWFFDLCNVESRDRERLEIANATLTQAFRGGVTAQTPVSVLSKWAIAAASLGLADAVRYMIPNQMRALAPERATAYKNGGVLANRMTLREGPQALDAERLGRASEALHLALLQSNPPAPGEDPVLHVFPAWPKEWSASYALLARGGFLVSASQREGRVAFVELESQAGSECRLRNPFDGEATLYRDGAKAEQLKGAMLRFATRKGERVTVLAAGTAPADVRRQVPPA
jgi:hypothetical protein